MSARFLPELRALFPGVEIQGKGLLATEGVISIPLMGRPAPVPAVTSHFLEFLDEGAFVGEMALFERAPRSASVKTLTPVRLLALSRTDFIGLLKKSPDLAMSVIQELSRRLRTINEQASALSFQRVKDRTKGLLERLATEPHGDGRQSTPSLTHQQIADMIGTSRETVTRVVKELKTSGWLEQEGTR